jgi:hypothetical protein
VNDYLEATRQRELSSERAHNNQTSSTTFTVIAELLRHELLETLVWFCFQIMLRYSVSYTGYIMFHVSLKCRW